MKLSDVLIVISTQLICVMVQIHQTTAQTDPTTANPYGTADPMTKSPTAEPEPETTMASGKEMEEIIKKVGKTCQEKIAACHKEAMKDKAELCTKMKDEKIKTCLLKKEGDKAPCTADEHTKLKDESCGKDSSFSPRITASVLLVVAMVFAAKGLASYY